MGSSIQGADAPSQRIWTKDFALATTSRFFYGVTFMLNNTTMTAFCMKAYGVGTGEAGMAAGVFVVAALISRVFAGRYADLAGRRTVLLASGAVYFALSLAYFAPMGFSAFALMRFLHGLAFGVNNNTLTVVVTEHLPDRRWGEALGYFSLASTLANAVAPFLGIALVHGSRFIAVLALNAVCSALAFLAIACMRVRGLELSPEQKAELFSGFKLRDFFEPAALSLSALAMVATLAFGSVNSFLSVHAESLGLSSYAPWFFVIYAVALMLTRPHAGKLLDREGENAVIGPAVVSMALGFAVLAFCAGGAAFFASACLLAVGFRNFFSNVQVVTVKAVEAHRVGLATSTFYALADFGLGMGPMAAGLLIPHVGCRGVYLVCAAVSAVLLAVYWVSHGRRV